MIGRYLSIDIGDGGDSLLYPTQSPRDIPNDRVCRELRENGLRGGGGVVWGGGGGGVGGWMWACCNCKLRR